MDHYGQGLAEKPRLVVLNKIDEAAADENLEPFRKATGEDPLVVSCLLGEGLEELQKRLFSFARSVQSSTT